eukprot:3070087-Prymnesium_polylepis.1
MLSVSRRYRGAIYRSAIAVLSHVSQWDRLLSLRITYGTGEHMAMCRGGVVEVSRGVANVSRTCRGRVAGCRGDVAGVSRACRGHVASCRADVANESRRVADESRGVNIGST